MKNMFLLVLILTFIASVLTGCPVNFGGGNTTTTERTEVATPKKIGETAAVQTKTTDSGSTTHVTTKQPNTTISTTNQQKTSAVPNTTMSTTNQPKTSTVPNTSSDSTGTGTDKTNVVNKPIPSLLSPFDAPILTKVEYFGTAPDAKFALNVIIPEEAFNFQGSYHGSGMSLLEIFYIDDNGVLQSMDEETVDLWLVDKTSDPIPFLVHAGNMNPNTAFQVRMTYHYTDSNGEYTLSTAWSDTLAFDAGSNSTPISPGGIYYKNSSFGFSLTLPKSWEGLYRMDENENGVKFIDIRNENADYGGFLFGIYVSDNVEPIEWGYRELTVYNGKHYYVSTPTDVQFAYDNEELTNEYNNMKKDIDTIIGTFQLGSN